MKKCLSCGAVASESDESCGRCGARFADQPDELIGATLADKYLIEEQRASGGMCQVYKGTHMAMGKQVAIKVLKPELAADPKIAERFEQEARAASRIHHPHAINVTDYGAGPDNRPFIVMELLDGETLGDLLRNQGALSVERAANILRQVCGALDAAHSVGVIHRDIKPDNIIISRYDGSDWVKVVDFGVAKVQEDMNRKGALTGANIIVGTPRYMSPEQCDERPVDARSDIYSLGVVLYEMLSGEAPFPGNSSTRLLMAHAAEPPPPLRQNRPDISPKVEAVVMRALEKDPARRPQTAGELAAQFEQAAELGQAARTGVERGGAFSRIAVPIGEEPPSAEDVTLDDEATLVRPRSQRERMAAANATNTPPYNTARNPYSTDPQIEASDKAAMSAGPQAGNPYPTPVQGTTYVAAHRGYEERSNAPLVVGVVVVLLAVAGLAAYLMFGDRLFGDNSPAGAVIDAQRAVTDAIARVESLPLDHPLRQYLPQLAKWGGELEAYQQVQNYTPQTVQIAERYEQRAEEIADQARSALASLSREAPTPTPAPAPGATPTEATVPPVGSPIPAQPPQPTEGEEGEEKDEEQDEQQPQNNNRRKPQSQPPVLDPVKPPPPKPQNSNRPKSDPPIPPPAA